MKSFIRPALTGLFLTAGIATAHAADLSGHYPPPPPVPVVSQPAESGWYLRGDVGVSVHRDAKWHESEIDSQDGTDDFNDWLSTKSSNSANLAVGVGYQFNDWLRADLTGEYRFASGLQGVQAQITSGGAAYYWGNDTADLTSWVFLANVYADIGDFGGLKPYIGAGIGAALNQFSGGTQISGGAATGSYGIYEDGDKWNLAGAFYAGLGYEINKQLTLDVGYRWLWLGDVSSGAKTCYDGTATVTDCNATQATEKWWLKGLNSHDIRVGLRYKFYEEPSYSSPVMAKN
jgi:opacity protein-like surface antigen